MGDVPPNGRSVRISYIHVLRFWEGKYIVPLDVRSARDARTGWPRPSAIWPRQVCEPFANLTSVCKSIFDR